ncbi:hypothetical protein [Paraferrimonas sp. SM1919]|uniref:hypothetical protein n=1 Tax=Paraferrimonas sp. SM1919 TaxID=2662263 RepID=UPI0013D4C1FC|nr:hypothetical protein [Paraferrimonas sp. SM1919]
MKKTIAALLIAIAMPASAAVLMQEWTEGMYRFCKYSDNSVIRVGFNEMCPRTI